MELNSIYKSLNFYRGMEEFILNKLHILISKIDYIIICLCNYLVL